MLTHGQMRTQSSTQHHTDLLEAVMSQKTQHTHAYLCQLPQPLQFISCQLQLLVPGSQGGSCLSQSLTAAVRLGGACTQVVRLGLEL
jgi:hypothetical protein